MSDSSPQQDIVRAHVIVSGRVQGVGYRFSTLYKARELGVSGWVRNLLDGRVEAVFEGDRAKVEAMIQWCDEGSSAAVVDEVVVRYEEPEGIAGFEVIR